MIKQSKGFRTARVIIASCKIIKCYFYVQKYLRTLQQVSYGIIPFYAHEPHTQLQIYLTMYQPNSKWIKHLFEKRSNQIRIISITADEFLPEFPASKRQEIYAIYFWANPFPSQSKHFLWKCETLQLNLSPWNRESSLSWETKHISHREDCDWREGGLSAGKTHWWDEDRSMLQGTRTEDVVHSSEDLCMQTCVQGWCCVCFCHWHMKILLILKIFLWQWPLLDWISFAIGCYF